METIMSVSVDDSTVKIKSPTKVLPRETNTEIDTHVIDKYADIEVETISAELKSRAHTPTGVQSFTLDHYTLVDQLTVENGVRRIEESTITIPKEAPNPIGAIDLWFDFEIETRDVTKRSMEYIEVETSEEFQFVFDTVIKEGLSLVDTHNFVTDNTDSPTFIHELTFSGEEEDIPSQIYLYLYRIEDSLAVHVNNEEHSKYSLPDPTVVVKDTSKESESQLCSALFST